MVVALAGVDDKLDQAEVAAIKKKVTAKVTVDRKSGLLQLAYEFRTPKQGNDFLIKEKPADVKGGLTLKPSTVATHVVPWETVQVECRVQVSKMFGTALRATESKIGLELGGDNFNTLYLQLPQRPIHKQVIIPYSDVTGLRSLRLELGTDTSLVAYDHWQVSEPTKLGTAGKIEFLGGNYGYAFRAVTFRGKPEASWLKDLVAEK
jgi:hypothetical protein